MYGEKNDGKYFNILMVVIFGGGLWVIIYFLYFLLNVSSMFI